jgi:hypothetical protein
MSLLLVDQSNSDAGRVETRIDNRRGCSANEES